LLFRDTVPSTPRCNQTRSLKDLTIRQLQQLGPFVCECHSGIAQFCRLVTQPTDNNSVAWFLCLAITWRGDSTHHSVIWCSHMYGSTAGSELLGCIWQTIKYPCMLCQDAKSFGTRGRAAPYHAEKSLELSSWPDDPAQL
jgi:hypothetical protein